MPLMQHGRMSGTEPPSEALGVVRQARGLLEGGDEYGLAQTFGTESPFFFRQVCRAYIC